MEIFIILVGAVLAIAPTLVLIEITHLVINAPLIRYMFSECVTVGSLVGIAYVLATHEDSGGISSLVASALTPFLVIGFAAGGSLAGAVYKLRGGVILTCRSDTQYRYFHQLLKAFVILALSLLLLAFLSKL